jgi:hypothetical protein
MDERGREPGGSEDGLEASEAQRGVEAFHQPLHSEACLLQDPALLGACLPRRRGGAHNYPRTEIFICLLSMDGLPPLFKYSILVADSVK